MNSKTTPYEEREQFTPASVQLTFRTIIIQRLNHLFNRLMNVIAPDVEPRVYKVNNKNGSTFFNAYDPVSGADIRTASEEELRIWLEYRRHYFHRVR